jgi:hypothetical protein
MRLQQYIKEEIEYIEFCNFIDENIDNLDESVISNTLKNKIDFIKDISTTIGTNIKDLINVFKDRKVFKFFQKIGWSLKSLYNLVKKGFKLADQLASAISEYVANTKVVKWTENELRKLDKWLSKHPKTRRIVGIGVAAILVYIWFNMTFTGAFDYDFDMSDMLAALAGSVVLSDLFTGPNGIKLLMLFTTGMIGLSFPWPGPSHILFVSAVVGTLIRNNKRKFKEVSAKVKRFVKI